MRELEALGVFFLVTLSEVLSFMCLCPCPSVQWSVCVHLWVAVYVYQKLLNVPLCMT